MDWFLSVFSFFNLTNIVTIFLHRDFSTSWMTQRSENCIMKKLKITADKNKGTQNMRSYSILTKWKNQCCQNYSFQNSLPIQCNPYFFFRELESMVLRSACIHNTLNSQSDLGNIIVLTFSKILDI